MRFAFCCQDFCKTKNEKIVWAVLSVFLIYYLAVILRIDLCTKKQNHTIIDTLAIYSWWSVMGLFTHTICMILISFLNAKSAPILIAMVIVCIILQSNYSQLLYSYNSSNIDGNEK